MLTHPTCPMDNPYTIRIAQCSDKDRIYALIRENIAVKKLLSRSSLVPAVFLEEFVDKVIRKGQMLVVENEQKELELIGEIHDYQTLNASGDEDVSFREFSFFSRMDSPLAERETTLVSWLFGEISSKHRDVFRVELHAPVKSAASVDRYHQMGLRVEGNYKGRLNEKNGDFHLLLPLSWSNPSFN